MNFSARESFVRLMPQAEMFGGFKKGDKVIIELAGGKKTAATVQATGLTGDNMVRVRWIGEDGGGKLKDVYVKDLRRVEAETVGEVRQENTTLPNVGDVPKEKLLSPVMHSEQVSVEEPALTEIVVQDPPAEIQETLTPEADPVPLAAIEAEKEVDLTAIPNLPTADVSPLDISSTELATPVKETVEGATSELNDIDFFNEQIRQEYFADAENEVREILAEMDAKFPADSVSYNAVLFNRKTKTSLYLLETMFKQFQTMYESLEEAVATNQDLAIPTQKLLKARANVEFKINGLRQAESELDAPIPFAPETVTVDSYEDAKWELENRLQFITNELKSHGFEPTQSQEFLDLRANLNIIKGESPLSGLPPAAQQSFLEVRYKKLQELYTLAHAVEAGLAESIRLDGDHEVALPTKPAEREVPVEVDQREIKTPGLPPLILTETERVHPPHKTAEDTSEINQEEEKNPASLGTLILTDKERVNQSNKTIDIAAKEVAEDTPGPLEENVEPAREVHRMTLAEMVERPFTEDELLTPVLYNINVRPYVLSALHELNVPAVQTITKSLDNIIDEINTLGTTPVQIAARVNKVIKNFYAQFSSPRNSEVNVDSAPDIPESSESSPKQVEGNLEKLTTETLINDFNTTISEFEPMYTTESARAVLAPLYVIKEALLQYHEPDPTALNNGLLKYQRKFVEARASIEALATVSVEMTPVVPAAVTEAKESISQLTPEDLSILRVDDKVFVTMDDGTTLETEVEIVWPDSNSVTVSWIQAGARKTKNFPIEKISKAREAITPVQAERAELGDTTLIEKTEEQHNTFTPEELDALRVDDKVVIHTADGERKVAEIDYFNDDKNLITVTWKENGAWQYLKLAPSLLEKYTEPTEDLQLQHSVVEAVSSVLPEVEKGATLDPVQLESEIQNNLFLSEDNRTTAKTLYENYERMKQEGKSEESLQKMLQSVKDTLNAPLDAETVMEVADSRQFVSETERQNIRSLYENYVRMKRDGRSEESLQTMVDSMRDTLEAPVDVMYLPDRAVQILAHIGQLEKVNPDAANTAKVFHANFVRLSEGGSDSIEDENKIRQAYKNLEDFVMYEGAAAGVELVTVGSNEVATAVENRREQLSEKYRTATAEYRQSLINLIAARKQTPWLQRDTWDVPAETTRLADVLEQSQKQYTETRDTLAKEFPVFGYPDKSDVVALEKKLDVPVATGRFKKLVRILALAGLVNLIPADNQKETSAYTEHLTSTAMAEGFSNDPDFGLDLVIPAGSRVTPKAVETIIGGESITTAAESAAPQSNEAPTIKEDPGTIYGVHLEDPVIPDTTSEPETIFSTHATPPSLGAVPGVEMPPVQPDTVVPIPTQPLTTTPEHSLISERLLAEFQAGTLKGVAAGMSESDFLEQMNQAIATLDTNPDIVVDRIGVSSGNLNIIPPNTTFDAGPIVSLMNGMSLETIATGSYDTATVAPIRVEVAEATTDSDSIVTVETNDRLFSVVDETIEPLLQGIPEFEQQALSADVRAMLLDLSSDEVKAMGILSGDINTLKVGEKINLSSVMDFVEDKTDGRWSPSPAETTSAPVPAESAQNSSVETEGIEIASSELTPTIITGDVAEQYLASYPGGNEAFNADLVRYIESIQGADPKGGWMAKMFAPDAGKANAFDAMKQFRVSELKEVNDFSPKERQALLRDKNIRVDDFKAWMSYVALLETSDRIKPWNNITLGEAVKRGFIDTKINLPRSNTADGILT